VGAMDSLPPVSAESLIAAIIRCKRVLDGDRARALHAAREYRLQPTPERLEDAVAAQVLLTYRQDDLAWLLIEVLRSTKDRTH